MLAKRMCLLRRPETSTLLTVTVELNVVSDNMCTMTFSSGRACQSCSSHVSKQHALRALASFVESTVHTVQRLQYLRATASIFYGHLYAG